MGYLFSWPGKIAYIGYVISICLLVCSVFLPIRVALFFLLTTFVGLDISQGQSELISSVESFIGSPWRLSVGPVTPGMLMMLVYLVIILRIWRVKILSEARYFLVYACLIGVAGFCIITLRNGGIGVPLSVVVSDIRMILFLMLSITMWFTFFEENPDDIYKYIQFIFLVFIARLLIDAMLLFTGEGSILSGAARGSVDSTQWTALVVAFFCMYNLFHNQKKCLSAILLVLSLIMIFAYMTRMNYISFILGSIIFLFTIRKKRVIFWGLPVTILLIVAGFWLFNKYMFDDFRIYVIRFRTVLPLLYLQMETADNFRYLEFINCLGSMLGDGSILTGRGFGGYYTDSIISMGRNMVDAFPAWSEETRHFARVHQNIVHFILKFGLIGTALWIILWLKIIINLWKIRFSKTEWESLRVILLAMSPAVFFSGYWSSKGIILTGIYISLSAHIYLKCNKKNKFTSKQSLS